MMFKKYFSLLLIAVSLVSMQPVFGAGAAPSATEESTGLIDDSIRDITIVISSGVVGAVLGLSTLSFVDKPSEHLKNVAIGGAVGIVIGVGAVIFNQASRSSAMALTAENKPINEEKFMTLSREEFKSFKIAQNYLKEPSVGYHFSF